MKGKPSIATWVHSLVLSMIIFRESYENKNWKWVHSISCFITCMCALSIYTVCIYIYIPSWELTCPPIQPAFLSRWFSFSRLGGHVSSLEGINYKYTIMMYIYTYIYIMSLVSEGSLSCSLTGPLLPRFDSQKDSLFFLTKITDATL